NLGINRDDAMTVAVGSKDLYALVHHIMTKAQEGVWYTDVGLDNFDRNDINAAKELINKSGYENEKIILLATREYKHSFDIAVVIQDQLQNLGLNVEMEAYEWSTYVEKYNDAKDTWDLAVVPNSP